MKTVSGKELTSQTYRHPFIGSRGPRRSGAMYVTTTDGTGLVHTAPGHGEDDYHTGIAEKLEVYCPVLANGRFDDTAPEWLIAAKPFGNPMRSSSKLGRAGLAVRGADDHPQLSARLAKQKADHLPRDGAVVCRDGQAVSSWWRLAEYAPPAGHRCGDQAS